MPATFTLGTVTRILWPEKDLGFFQDQAATTRQVKKGVALALDI